MTLEERRARNATYQRAYYRRHRDKALARVAAYQRRDPSRSWTWTNEWRRLNPDRVRELKRLHGRTWNHRSRLKKVYGISLEKYEALLSDQGDVCALCGRPPDAKRYLCVDHDHVTGRIRGFIHTSCNVGLGCFGDDPTRLRLAADYLERSH